MSLVTQAAPDFTANSVSAENTIEEFKLSNLKGKYVVLLFYPLDFTFVCPSELIAFDRKAQEFRDRNVEVVFVSIDSEYTHLAWRNTPRKEGGVGQMSWTMVADIDKSIARNYGVLFNSSVALRGQFLIDQEGIVRHELINDLPLGRSVDEALRMVDALQFFEENGEVCPANWHKGEEGMTPSAEGVASYLAKHE